MGRRSSRTYSTSTMYYVYDGNHIIAEYSSTGSLIRKYIYGPGIDNPVAMIRRISSTDYWYYYYTDALGSVRLLTNASGAVVESYTYDPYGQARVMYSAGPDGNWLTEDVATQTYSSLGNCIMFTGRLWDSTTKLYHYRARDYSPDLGRFLQTDPIGYADSMNLYAYCGNNPVNFLDPWGLWSEEGHRRLGELGDGQNDPFDYAQLDEDQPATNSAYRWRHFRHLGDAYQDAQNAAREGNRQAFEYHMHEVQDYYAHRGAGHKNFHLRKSVDDPTHPNNRGRYQRADQRTRELEKYWEEQRNIREQQQQQPKKKK